MSHDIEELQEIISKKKKQLEDLQRSIDFNERNLAELENRESFMLNEVLRNNMIDILKMIEACGLKCVSICPNNKWINYKISMYPYYANITIEKGKIIWNTGGIDNDGAGSKLYEIVENLIEFDIKPYCEEHINNYRWLYE